MADLDGRIREWLAAFEPAPTGLRRILERRRRRDRNRRILSGTLALLMAAGGLAGAFIAFRPGNDAVRGRGFLPDSRTCLSEDEPGLITCEEALQRAAEEEGRPGHEVHAELSWLSPRPGAERKRVWIVTYEDVRELGFGPSGGTPECVIDDWRVVIDARTGAFLVAGNAGAGRPCPSPEAAAQAVPDSEAQAIHAEDIRISIQAEGQPEVVFVLDQLCADAGGGPWSTDCSVPISEAERQALVAAMSRLATVVFVSSDEEALGTDGWVRDLGLLIHLGPVVMRGDRIAVGRNFTRQNPSCAEGELRFLEPSEKEGTDVQTEATARCSLRSTSEPDATFSRVLQPASRPCGSGIVRAGPVPTGAAPEAMRGYLPRWLPKGFGVAGAWGVAGDEDGPLVQWSDSRCREVELRVAFLPPIEEALVGPNVGSWTIVGDVSCFTAELGTTRCLRYQTAVPEGLLALNFTGVERDEADRIALSIPRPPASGGE